MNTKPKLVKKSKVTRFPRSPKRIKDFIRMLENDANTNKFKAMLDVSIDGNNKIWCGWSGGNRSALEKLGMATYAMLEIYNAMKD